MGAGTSGNFSTALSGLAPATTYYYKAYVIVGTDYYYSSVKSFTTASASAGDGESDPATFAKSWLACYEMPATSATISAGKPYHSKVSETFGSTYAYIYNPSSASQRVVTHTFSYNSDVKRNYSMLYDKDKKCALWEAYAMHKDEYKDNGVGRHEGWTTDPAIPGTWQPSGTYPSYSRGHQVASADRQTTVEQNKQTFYYSNMTPQNSSLNSGQWNALENKVQALGQTVGGRDTLYVVTGPIFGDSPATVSDGSGHACAIPSGYYKCLLKCSFDAYGNMTAASGAAYYFNSNSDNVSYQLKSIDYIESLTGFDFFANVPATLQNSAESSPTDLLSQ